MDAAERILLSLDAYECLPPRVRQVRASVEPVVVRHSATADFGTTINGLYTVAELQDIMASWAYRMQQLGQAYANISPAWVARDSASYVAWTNDWNALQARYTAALKQAQSAVTTATINVFTPNSLIPAQTEYTGLMKAMRQSYPPDGGPQTKGDFDDLNLRLNAAATLLGTPAAAPVYPAMPQPTATDVAQQVFAAGAPADPVAQFVGAQKTGPLPNAPGGLSWLAWIEKHKVAIVVGGVVIVGGIFALEIIPLIAIPLKAVKGFAALAA
jgi:hypothetical protein